MSNQESLKHRETIECARAAVRQDIAIPLSREADGAVIEMIPCHGAPSNFVFYKTPKEYASAVAEKEQRLPEPLEVSPKASFGTWIFGPERVDTPSIVFRKLSESLCEGGTVLIATEVPWPGKILSSDERAEYTAEETGAAMVRAGFHDIDKIVEGPFFRIWKAKRSRGEAHLALIDAETHLSAGDHEAAEKALHSLVEQLDSVLAVREYALLVAACQDLAGRYNESLNALAEALALDPRSARAMTGLGRLSALRGDLESATEFFQSALRCEPALVAALHGMAVVHEARDDLGRAFKYMLTASDLRPGDTRLLSEASRLGNACGNLDDVARFISHRLVQFPVPPVVVEALSRPVSQEARN